MPDDPEEITLSPGMNYSTTYEEISCRFCMGEENSIENPMITPCKCSGTMKFIHIECLRGWTRSKLFIR
jgi:E3 ubiquitin-protein ligase DOA10